MLDSKALRANMVAAQLRTNDVHDPRVLKAILAVPRERFVPVANASEAYMEGYIDLGRGRLLNDPRSLGKLLQLAEVAETDSVLDVGCATGYSTAVLSHLAVRVYGLESDPELAKTAIANLQGLGAANARVVTGSLPEGQPGESPFNVIFVNGAIEEHPEKLLSQLANNGRLVAIVREGAAGHGFLYVKHDGAISERSAFDALLPVLPGFAKKPQFVF
jgi:protein-L-isoaspartate(D-aspartate) O-methyltransferase